MGLARVRPDSEFSGNPVVTLGEMLVCPRWQSNFVGTVTGLAGTLANRSLFLKELNGEIGPLPAKSAGFSFFCCDFLIYFNYYLRGLGSLALILSLLFKDAKKKKYISLLSLLAKIKCNCVI